MPARDRGPQRLGRVRHRVGADVDDAVEVEQGDVVLPGERVGRGGHVVGRAHAAPPRTRRRADRSVAPHRAERATRNAFS